MQVVRSQKVRVAGCEVAESEAACFEVGGLK